MKKFVGVLLISGLAIGACGDSTDGADATTEPSKDSTATIPNAAGTMTATTGAAVTGGDCAVDKLDLFADGRLTVATGEPAYAPWVLNDDPASGEGYEAAVVYELASRLGFATDEVDWVRTTFDEAITPAPKDYDFNLQQYTITDEREEAVDFSYPYYDASRVVVTIEGSPAQGKTTLSELKDLKWGATIGTHDLDYIERVIGASDVAVYDDQAGTNAALTSGQIDATVVNYPTGYLMANVEIDGGVVAGVLPDSADGTEQFGFIFADGSPLVDCIDPVLMEMAADGSLEALTDEWLASDANIPVISAE